MTFSRYILAAQEFEIKKFPEEEADVREWVLSQIPEKFHEVDDPLVLLRAVATGEISHIYNGSCPDEDVGFQIRDPGCVVCQILMQTEK